MLAMIISNIGRVARSGFGIVIGSESAGVFSIKSLSAMGWWTTSKLVCHHVQVSELGSCRSAQQLVVGRLDTGLKSHEDK